MAHVDDTPEMLEARSRAAESRSQVLGSRAAGDDRFASMAADAAKEAADAAKALAGIPAVPVDPEGLAPTLADSEGNFATNPEVATAGGIGVKASNTAPSGQVAKTAEEALKPMPDASDAEKAAGEAALAALKGDAAVSSRPQTRADGNTMADGKPALAPKRG